MFWRHKPLGPADPDVPTDDDATIPTAEGNPTDESAQTQPAAPAEVPAHDAPAHQWGWSGPTDEAGGPIGAAPPATIDAGLRPSRGFVTRLRTILGTGTDEAAWEEVEETLIEADVGARLAIDIVASARRRTDAPTPIAAVEAELRSLLVPRPPSAWAPPRPDAAAPAVVLMVGVNGTGKTTSIAKLAARLKASGQRVLLAAADTFRAAAIEQLQAWARRLDVPVVAHAAGADPSAVVFDALDAGIARRADVVIVDTAGRLHTKHNLMDELAKIRRTIDKRLPGADPAVLFVLDATTGQNGLAQAEAFQAVSPLTGIVLSKLDSTAKGGIVFAIERSLGVPVVFVGVGERLEDLVDFDPDEFIAALFA
jgi:fused signal recognition particle receptor